MTPCVSSRMPCRPGARWWATLCAGTLRPERRALRIMQWERPLAGSFIPAPKIDDAPRSRPGAPTLTTPPAAVRWLPPSPAPPFVPTPPHRCRAFARRTRRRAAVLLAQDVYESRPTRARPCLFSPSACKSSMEKSPGPRRRMRNQVCSSEKSWTPPLPRRSPSWRRPSPKPASICPAASPTSATRRSGASSANSCNPIRQRTRIFSPRH